MNKLGNFVTGKWINGEGAGQALYNAVTGEEIYRAGTGGLDFGAALEYGRRVGNPALRKMTFSERGSLKLNSTPDLGKDRSTLPSAS